MYLPNHKVLWQNKLKLRREFFFILKINQSNLIRNSFGTLMIHSHEISDILSIIFLSTNPHDSHLVNKNVNKLVYGYRFTKTPEPETM